MDCTHTYTHTCMSAQTHLHGVIPIYICIHTYIYIPIYTYTPTCPTYIHTDTYVRMYKSKISRPPKTMHIVYPKNTQCGYTCIAIPSYIFDDNVQAQIVCS